MPNKVVAITSLSPRPGQFRIIHKLGEVWAEYASPSRKVWKLQAPKGVLTFKRETEALRWQATFHPDTST